MVLARPPGLVNRNQLYPHPHGLRLLLCLNGEVLETSSLLGDVEGQGLRGRAAAGIFHVVHFASHGAERFACLQSLSSLALNLKDRRAFLDINEFITRLRVLAASQAVSPWSSATAAMQTEPLRRNLYPPGTVSPPPMCESTRHNFSDSWLLFGSPPTLPLEAGEDNSSRVWLRPLPDSSAACQAWPWGRWSCWRRHARPDRGSWNRSCRPPTDRRRW